MSREIGRIRSAVSSGRQGEKALEDRLDKLEQRILAGIDRRRRRESSRPEMRYPENLPILSKKDQIIDAISKHQVIIVSGETGSGKTTQLPKFCIEAGRGIDGIIGCTQPRRIAAITVAGRIAQELEEAPGNSVGYKIRFQDTFNRDRSFIKLMTDGILLAEANRDRFLNEYDTLIIDEAHERSLNIDFILGMLRQLTRKRPDLKLIITSATIDTEKFSKAFEDAPIIEVSGRMYPVDVRYADDGANDDDTYVDKAADAADRVTAESRSGDVLIFMPTEQDIRDTCEILSGRRYPHTTVLPLYARLSAADQMKVFSPQRGRKIVVATNVAETSITVPGIRYVIDTGLARISRYEPRSRTTCLPVLPVSRSSADQRKGRCGRVQNGICIRLFTQEDYENRPLYTLPEILRANLSDVILRMIALKLGDIEDFPFIDPPPARQIKDGFDLLFELGAIEKQGKNTILTRRGRLMAKIPLDPRLSRMLIESRERGCLAQVVVIASALTIGDPRERPENFEQAADAAHAPFKDPASDFVTLYNIWKACFGEPNLEKSTSIRAARLKQFCRKNYMSFKRMREWQDIFEQITGILAESGMDLKAAGAAKPSAEKQGVYSDLYTAVHKSILSGFLSNIALKKEKNLYQAAKQRTAMIFPGSGLFNKAGTWIVAAEMVETSRLFARTAANIDSGWLEELGREQCRYAWLNPRWEKNREAVVADEQVSLFGLVIISGRTVLYGPHDPKTATEIFIRNALIEGDVKFELPFMTANRALIEDVKDMESRVRRRDLLISEAALFEFYDQRLENVYDMPGLKKKIREAGSDAFLRMGEADVLAAQPDPERLLQFPDTVNLGENQFACTYRFLPGEKEDGVTIRMPKSAVSSVPADTADWIVPGLLEEKITALIRSLPKSRRKALVPIGDTVAVIMEQMPKYQGSLLATLSAFIFKRFKVDIPVSEWNTDELADHLKLRFSITDEAGRELVSGRDRSVLRQVGGPAPAPAGFDRERRQWEREGLTGWDFPDLPEVILVSPKKRESFPVYPALTDVDGRVDLRLFTDKAEAQCAHPEGVARLFSLYFAKDLKFLHKNLAVGPDMAAAARHFGGKTQVRDRLYDRVIRDLFAVNIRTKKLFLDHAQFCVNRILPAGQALTDAVFPVIGACHEAYASISALQRVYLKSEAIQAFLGELAQGLSQLVPPHFIDLYDGKEMARLVRYAKAVRLRAERGVSDMDKDRRKAARVSPFASGLHDLVDSLDASASDEKRDAVEEFFWMLEEYKVSVFAQELKTAFPVSPRKLADLEAKIRRMI